MVLTVGGVALKWAGRHAQYGHFVDHRSDAAVPGYENGKLRLKVDAFEMQDLDEVLGYLASQGYQTVVTEDLTSAEQVRRFQSAASIMASTGSALQTSSSRRRTSDFSSSSRPMCITMRLSTAAAGPWAMRLRSSAGRPLATMPSVTSTT